MGEPLLCQGLVVVSMLLIVLERNARTSKNQRVLQFNFQTPPELDKTWKTQNIWAQTPQTHILTQA